MDDSSVPESKKSCVCSRAQQQAGSDSSSGADWLCRGDEERSRAGGRQTERSAPADTSLSPDPGGSLGQQGGRAMFNPCGLIIECAGRTPLQA